MQTSKGIHETERVLLGFDKLPLIAVHVLLKSPTKKTTIKPELQETTLQRKRASADSLRDAHYLNRMPF